MSNKSVPLASRVHPEGSDLDAELAIVSGRFRRATRHLTYLRFARWLRKFVATFNLWRTALLTVTPMLCWVLTFIVFHYAVGSLYFAIASACIGAALGLCVSWALMYCPPDESITAQIHGVEAQLSQASQRINEIASRKDERTALLELSWKSMSGYDWEHYLIRVCEALGGIVEHTGKCGDQGCDLIVQFTTKRIAVQAKGYDEHNHVNHKAVQEAYTGMAFHSCDACAVITNTRFRKSARAVAAKTGCILIGRNEFPDFVMGKIQLQQIPDEQC